MIITSLIAGYVVALVLACLVLHLMQSRGFKYMSVVCTILTFTSVLVMAITGPVRHYARVDDLAFLALAPLQVSVRGESKDLWDLAVTNAVGDYRFILVSKADKTRPLTGIDVSDILF
jgi:uncharacterized protein YacL